MKQLTAMLEMLEGTADGALVLDQDGKVVFWNRAAERLLGFRAEEVLGRPCHEVIGGKTLSGQPLCSVSCTIAARITRGTAVRNFDIQTRTKASRPIWLNVSSLPIPSRKQGRFRVAHLFRDITKQAKVRQLVEELHTALCCVAGGDPEQPQLNSLPDVPADLPLSEREREVLRLLASGKDTRSIADSLCISPATVRNHIQHILEKLGCHNRLQALALAFHSGVPSQ